MGTATEPEVRPHRYRPSAGRQLDSASRRRRSARGLEPDGRPPPRQTVTWPADRQTHGRGKNTNDRDSRGGTSASSVPTSVTAPPGGARHSLSPRLQLGFKALVPLGLVALALTQRRLIGSSLQVLAHLNWIWLPAAVELESASIAMLARMQRRLLRAGGARIGLWPVLATTYAGNAIAVSVPVAGTQVGITYAFRRFKKLGVDSTLAGWSLLVSGALSSLASAGILAAGAILSGNDAVALAGVATGVLGAVAIVVASVAIRRPRLAPALERPLIGIIRLTQRVIHRPAGSARDLVVTGLDRLRSLHLTRADWAKVLGLAFGNWLADAGVLAVSLIAVGAGVPWRGLLFAYGVGATVGSLGLTPGGLGVVEGALTVALMGVGVRHGDALAAVLLYRFISFWMVSGVGWLVYLLGRTESSGSHVGGHHRGLLPRHLHLRH